MEYKKITEQEFESARDYISTAEKNDFIEEAAKYCTQKMDLSVDGQSVPPMYMESQTVKANFLMGALSKLYFGIDFTPIDGTKYLMRNEDYDFWAGGHAMNQIDRFKGNAKYRNKAFDLLQDFKTLEKALNSEVYGLLSAKNDILTRSVMLLQYTATQESLAQYAKDLDNAKNELAAYIANRDKKKSQ